MKTILFFKKLYNLALRPKALLNSIRYHFYLKYRPINWDVRAQNLGKLAVLDSRHSDEEYDDVTKYQKEKFFPLFKKILLPSDKTVLDFGCGVGRFTADLAELINGVSVGVDVSKKLLDLCVRSQNVDFCLVSEISTLRYKQFDVIFCCLVLGGISNRKLLETIELLDGLLSNNGLFFLVESTGKRYRPGNWRIRTVPFYKRLMPNCDIDLIGSYVDAGQEISIMAGRKNLA